MPLVAALPSSRRERAPTCPWPRLHVWRRDDKTGAVRWYVYDGLGSVVGEVSPDGSLTCTRKLDVYGCVRSSSGTATSKHKFVGSLGHPSDDETGLIYMRARHYDPVTGRFISEDPGRNGSNWFAYCSSDPVNKVDADGREDISNSLSYAWRLFEQFLKGRMSSTNAIRAIMYHLENLKKIAGFERFMGAIEIDEAADEAGAGAFMGDGADLSMEIADIQAGIGSISMAYGVSAELAVRTVETMIQIIELFE